MELKSFEEFVLFYDEKGKLPFPLTTWTNKKLNEKQLKSKYKDYCEKIKQISTIKEKTKYMNKVDEAMKEVHSAGNYNCYYNFYNSLSQEKRKILDDNLWLCPKNENGEYIFDGCHFIERSKKSSMSYNTDNIVLLPRYLHKCLDDRINPWDNSKTLSQDEHYAMWEKILGKERIENLINLYKN